MPQPTQNQYRLFSITHVSNQWLNALMIFDRPGCTGTFHANGTVPYNGGSVPNFALSYSYTPTPGSPPGKHPWLGGPLPWDGGDFAVNGNIILSQPPDNVVDADLIRS